MSKSTNEIPQVATDPFGAFALASEIRQLREFLVDNLGLLSSGNQPAKTSRNLSILEAAKLLRISERTLRQKIKDGKIRVVKLGNRQFIAPAELERIQSEGA
jgi:excisionase family DNA binding protein